MVLKDFECRDVKLLPKLDVRIPKWDQAKLYKRDCPFCGLVGIEAYIRPDGLYINCCKSCGAYFVSNPPDGHCLSEFYKNYFSKHNITGKISESDYTNIINFDPMWDMRIMEIISIMDPRSKTLLDVGCGKGYILYGFQKLGASVMGIDLDLDCVEFIKSRLGIENVKNCDIESLGIDGGYDIITMYDFIEHPLDPIAALTKAARLLNTGGVLSLWTPNASFAVEEDNPVLFRVDLEHMQYLSFKTCRYIADKLGLNLIHLESLGFPNLREIIEPDCTLSNSETHKDVRLGRYHLFCIFLKT